MSITGALDLVASAKQEIENLQPGEVAGEIEDGGAVLIDLRERGELDDHGSIPGAVHAPRGMLEFYADPTTPYHMEPFRRDARIILYCASGGRSALACRTLKELGYADVAHLDGGFKAWIAAGRPVERR